MGSLSLGRERAAQKISSSESFSSKPPMILSIFQVLVAVLVCVGNGVNAASNCDEALEESTACQDRAMAAHDADYVEPSVELGKDWLELEARRNCRFITSINTCIDELVAFCPDMLKPVTKSYLGVVDKFEELAVGYGGRRLGHGEMSGRSGAESQERSGTD